MDRTLILAGWGYLDSACAAAAILRLLPKADVVPMGGRRLAGYIKALKDVPSYRLRRLFIVGVSPPTEETGLAETIEFLVRSKCQVYWFGWDKVCANDLREKGAVVQCPTDRLGSLCAAATAALELEDAEDLTGLVKEDSGHDAFQAALLLESAAFSYSRTRSTGAYADVVRFLAEGSDNAHLPTALDRVRRRYRESKAWRIPGPSALLAEVRALADRAAAVRDCCILVTGEEGTAKEAVAARIHRKSARNTSPLIRFICAGSSEDEIYTRLFGEGESISRTSESKQGDLALADGGTLFLDEVERLPLKVQGCLLDVIETGRHPCETGGPVDVRLVADTDCDLLALTRQGRFRMDLLQLLSTVTIRVPPLRERPEDIRAIAAKYWIRNFGRPLPSRNGLDALAAYPWPGNLDELYAVLRRARILGEENLDHLLKRHWEQVSSVKDAQADPPLAASPDCLEVAICRHVQSVLARCGGNVTRAAKALDVSPTTVRRYRDLKSASSEAV